MKIKDVINGFAVSLRSVINKLILWLLLQKIICEVVFSREKPRNKKRKMPGKSTASTKETETHHDLPSCLPEACGEEPAITIAISKPISTADSEPASSRSV